MLDLSLEGRLAKEESVEVGRGQEIKKTCMLHSSSYSEVIRMLIKGLFPVVTDILYFA